MKTYKRCVPCFGSGKTMGLGMMLQECAECDGLGKIEVINDELAYLQIQTSEGFQNAIDKIVKETGLPREKAEALMAEEFGHKPKTEEPTNTEKPKRRKKHKAPLES